MKDIKLINNRIVMFFLFIPFVEPSGTEEMAQYIGGAWKQLHLFFLVLKWAAFLFVALFLLTRRLKISRIIWLLVLFQLWLLLITEIRIGLDFSYISNSITAIGAALLFDIYLLYGDKRGFLRVVEIVLLVWIVINFITILMYPNGMYIDDRKWWANWFLGYKNRHIYYYLLFFAISSMSQYIRKKRLTINYFLVILLAIVSSFICETQTTVISLALFVVAVVFLTDINLPKQFNMFTIYILSILGSVFVISGSATKILNLINVFNKDIRSVSSRNIIWIKALNDIAKHPISGNGLISYTNLFKTWTVTQMHNMYLDIWVSGGLVAIAIFTIIIFMEDRRLRESTAKTLNNILLFVFLAYGVLFISEARRNMELLYMFFMLLYYLPLIVEEYDLSVARKRLVKFVIKRRTFVDGEK